MVNTVATVHLQSDPVTLATSVDDNGAWVEWPGGDGLFAVNGTWDGATAALEFSLDGGSTAIGAGDGSTLTDDGAFLFHLPRCLIRVGVSGAGTTSLNATAQRG